MAFSKRRKKNFGQLIEIDDKWISGEVVEEKFVCDLLKCKGACCVEGDLGAPLEKEELPIMKRIYEQVEPYMRPEGKRAVAEQGTYLKDFTGTYSTPLVEGKECAYVSFNEQGLALCTIEQAWKDGKIDFQKPISCHLYPIRVSKHRDFEALNYDEWDICSPACSHGATVGMRVFEFTKAALIRKYGEAFYQTLTEIVAQREAAEKE